MSAVEPLAVSRMTGDGAALAELAHDLDAVEVGHDDVEEDDVRADLLGLLERLLAAVGGDDAEALLAEGDRDELGDARLVVGDEDEGLGAHRITSWVGDMVTDCPDVRTSRRRQVGATPRRPAHARRALTSMLMSFDGRTWSRRPGP